MMIMVGIGWSAFRSISDQRFNFCLDLKWRKSVIKSDDAADSHIFIFSDYLAKMAQWAVKREIVNAYRRLSNNVNNLDWKL